MRAVFVVVLGIVVVVVVVAVVVGGKQERREREYRCRFGPILFWQGTIRPGSV